MRKHSAQEWMLSLVTTPDRASAILGDLIESGGTAFDFWVALGSNVLHSMTLAAFGMALVGFVFQFLIFLLPSFAIMRGLRVSAISTMQFASYSDLSFLGTQVITGYWIGSWGRSRAFLVALIVAVIDCGLGVLNVNNASINMAVWAFPLLGGAILQRRNSLRRT